MGQLKWQIKAAVESDLDALQTVARVTFQETFAHLNSAADMAAYNDKFFNSAQLQLELGNPSSRFFIAFTKMQAVGYLKLNFAPAQTELNDPRALEIERIYIRRAYYGSGLGQQLMHIALNMANAEGLHYLWLGVWEKNWRAQAFYHKFGFKAFSDHVFMMGKSRQRDILMRLFLAEKI
jgi:ribosomal protein S18 acetylase RimI-like enzyme